MTNTTVISTSSNGSMTLDELVNAVPIPATQEMPADLQAMLTPDSGVYIRSRSQPRLDLTTRQVPGSPDTWVLESARDEELLTAIPGETQTELNPEDIAALEASEDAVESTEGYRPPWVPQEYLPRLAPFRVDNQLFFEPMAHEETNRLAYPFRTVGIVFNSNGKSGTGVLVGPNLLLTAGHIAPWGANPWSMEFFPAYRRGSPPPFGSSFVQEYRGYNPTPAAGYDYVICKLYKPLGQALGWMGSQSWGNENEYYRRRYVSTGYPGTFGGRPAVELDMGLRDIDNDSPGLELEFSEANRDFGPGWSGGPLWLPHEGPRVVGVCSGAETDGFDPRFVVFSAGRAMVDLVNFGLTNWRP